MFFINLREILTIVSSFIKCSTAANLPARERTKGEHQKKFGFHVCQQTYYWDEFDSVLAMECSYILKNLHFKTAYRGNTHALQLWFLKTLLLEGLRKCNICPSTKEITSVITLNKWIVAWTLPPASSALDFTSGRHSLGLRLRPVQPRTAPQTSSVSNLLQAFSATDFTSF